MAPENKASASDFKQTFKEVWSEPKARTFTIFVFLSMLAVQRTRFDFGALRWRHSWHVTRQNHPALGLRSDMGVLIGMPSVAAASSRCGGRSLGFGASLDGGGLCSLLLPRLVLSSSALINMTEAWPLKGNVIFLGVANGAFSIAAIATMMRLAGEGGPGREGTRMGLWVLHKPQPLV
jgi:BCD family chlorophyll transporter-like MFS transporter